MNPGCVEEAWWGMGHPTAGGVMIVADHASRFVPPDIDLGVDDALLNEHIACDIGVAEVAQALVASAHIDCAFLGGVSRLVADYNRAEDAAGVVPAESDGHSIPGNQLSPAGRSARMARFYYPYHSKLAEIVAGARPKMIVSLHSFTPQLRQYDGMPRPWEIGILYNEDDRLARVAIPALEARGLNVGDQLPYSGKLLNHTMNLHAEANDIPYLGVEMRQDMVRTSGSISAMHDHLAAAILACRNYLAHVPDGVK